MINRTRLLTIHSIIIIFIMLGCFPTLIYSVGNLSPAELVLSGELKNGTRVIEVTAYKYGFYPNPIVVKYGEKVRFLMIAMDVPHGIHIPEFKVDQLLPKGVMKTIEFTASQKGQFMVHCSVYCGPNHGKQKTRLIVR